MPDPTKQGGHATPENAPCLLMVLAHPAFLSRFQFDALRLICWEPSMAGHDRYSVSFSACN